MPNDCYDGKGKDLMANRNRIMEEFYERHSKQKAFDEVIGMRKFCKMPEKAIVMPFYSRRSKVKNKIRGQKLDSCEWANVGNGEELKKAW